MSIWGAIKYITNFVSDFNTVLLRSLNIFYFFFAAEEELTSFDIEFIDLRYVRMFQAVE